MGSRIGIVTTCIMLVSDFENILLSVSHPDNWQCIEMIIPYAVDILSTCRLRLSTHILAPVICHPDYLKGFSFRMILGQVFPCRSQSLVVPFKLRMLRKCHLDFPVPSDERTRERVNRTLDLDLLSERFSRSLSLISHPRFLLGDSGESPCDLALGIGRERR